MPELTFVVPAFREREHSRASLGPSTRARGLDWDILVATKPFDCSEDLVRIRAHAIRACAAFTGSAGAGSHRLLEGMLPAPRHTWR